MKNSTCVTQGGHLVTCPCLQLLWIIRDPSLSHPLVYWWHWWVPVAKWTLSIWTLFLGDCDTLNVLVLSYTTTSQTDRVNKQFHVSYVCWPPATEYNNININVRLNWGFMSTPSGFTMTGLLADKWGRRLNTEENKQCSPVFCKSALVGKLDAIYTLFVLQFCSPKYQYLSVLLQKLTNVLL